MKVATVFSFVISKQRVVLGTSLAGLITIPLWLRFGMKWVGL